jgi:hypothetical protein
MATNLAWIGIEENNRYGFNYTFQYMDLNQPTEFFISIGV